MSTVNKAAENFDEYGKLYRRWGTYFNFRQNYEKAALYFNLSLNLKEDDALGLYKRSIIHENRGNPKSARNDALLAYNDGENKHIYALQLCNTTKDLNWLEQHAVEAYYFRRKFTGTKTQHYQKKIDVLNSNYEDTVGESLGPFFIKNIKRINFIAEQIKKKELVDHRAIWKQRKENGECDVTSIAEKKKEMLHPREKARRHTVYKIFNQTYYGKSWRDMYYLKKLRKNKILTLPQSKITSPMIAKELKADYDATYTYMLMLYSRSPNYNEKGKRFKGNDLLQKNFQNEFLSRVQLRNRRLMFSALQKIKELREAGNINNLIEFVEDVMNDYFVLTTHRIMPWKYEFYSDIFNIIALSFIDKLNVPVFNSTQSLQAKQCQLLAISKEESRRGSKFVFGNRLTYVPPDRPDFKYIAYKKRVNKLLKRLRFAEYPIEKAYLNHEIGRNHINQGRYEEAIIFSTQSIEASETCNSNVWSLLGNILMCRAAVTTHKVEKINIALQKCKALAEDLDNEEITRYIEVCDRLHRHIHHL